MFSTQQNMAVPMGRQQRTGAEDECLHSRYAGAHAHLPLCAYPVVSDATQFDKVSDCDLPESRGEPDHPQALLLPRKSSVVDERPGIRVDRKGDRFRDQSPARPIGESPLWP